MFERNICILIWLYCFGKTQLRRADCLHIPLCTFILNITLFILINSCICVCVCVGSMHDISYYWSLSVCHLVPKRFLFCFNVGPYQVPIGTILSSGLDLSTLHPPRRTHINIHYCKIIVVASEMKIKVDKIMSIRVVVYISCYFVCFIPYFLCYFI